MPAKVEWVLAVRLDATGCPTQATVTKLVNDQTETYVTQAVEPFVSYREVMAELLDGVEVQHTLW